MMLLALFWFYGSVCLILGHISVITLLLDLMLSLLEKCQMEVKKALWMSSKFVDMFFNLEPLLLWRSKAS